MRAVPGRPSPQPITAGPGAAQDAERAPARPLWRPRARREWSQNWAAKGPTQLTDTRAATERVLRERLSESGPEAPEGRTLSRRAAVRLQGTGLLTPGQRPGAESTPWGPAIFESPYRPHLVHRHQGPRSGARPAAGRVGRPPGGHCEVRYGHCRRPAKGLTAPR